MSNCSNHSKELFGQTDMKVVAEAIGDLHYEALSEFMEHFYSKIRISAIRDYGSRKYKLAEQLRGAAKHIELAHSFIEQAWRISKPFMDTTK